MATRSDGLFWPLWKLAKANRQDENFITEAFAYLLRQLASREQAVFSQLMVLLTGEPNSAWDHNAKVSTQVRREGVIADVVVENDAQYVVIEVKVESGLSGNDQPDRCHGLVESEQGRRRGRFVLLSQWEFAQPCPGHRLRWSEVGDFLAAVAPERTDPAARLLIVEFVSFLGSRGMLREKVNEQIESGVVALVNFRELLDAVFRDDALNASAALKGSTVSVSTGEFYLGRIIAKGGESFWVGITYDDPGAMTFHTVKFPLSMEKAKTESELDNGDVRRKQFYCYLWFKDSAFYALTRTEQEGKAREFVEGCVEFCEKNLRR